MVQMDLVKRIIEYPEQYEACSVTWEGNLCLPAFVYNRDFVRDNFKQTNSKLMKMLKSREWTMRVTME